MAVLLASLLAGVLGGTLLLVLGGRRAATEIKTAAEIESRAIKKSAEREVAQQKAEAQGQAHESALKDIEARERKDEKRRVALEEREAKLQDALGELQSEAADLQERWDALKEQESAVKGKKNWAKKLRKQREGVLLEIRERLQEECGQSTEEVVRTLRAQWIEEIEADASHSLRLLEQSANSPQVGRDATRMMSIATSRYQNHFLTERNFSTIQLLPGVVDILSKDNNRVIDVLAQGANTKLHLNEEGTAIRMEGIDGVGREVARRALKALGKKKNAAKSAGEDPEAWVQNIRQRLDQEIEKLGHKAFKVLKVPTAHDEIVNLVGALNYRTSYTQNQWLHAVEAAFLAGMMADEMGLDIGMARRATLLHDIGKALTHKIEGSHAVIGADIARRLGEDEIVANAIGSHHADEPANSAYAFLVAAADAMSGARPGARREQSEGFSSRLEDLERLGSSFPGVDYCAAVYGGRELRVYVHEKEVGDLEAVELSTSIAEEISDKLTFPGQVKVTVIRSSESVSIAS